MVFFRHDGLFFLTYYSLFRKFNSYQSKFLSFIGTLEGPILGTLLYFLLRESFAQYGLWYFIGLGSLAIATMVVAPGGA